MQKFSYLKSSNADYIDELFARFVQDPNSVDESWRYFFEGLELGAEVEPGAVVENGHAEVSNGAAAPSAAMVPSPTAGLDLGGEAKVAELIEAYRQYGRLVANLDPLSAAPSSHPYLELSRFGLSNADLSKTFHAGKLIGMGPAKLSDVIARLRDIYCRTVGVEYDHIENPEQRAWLQKRIESTALRDPELNAETRKWILKRLSQSEGFERFLHTRYVAQKRFSVEGGETSIPTLDCMIEAGAELGVRDVVLGMAHRGRLNVLTHIFGKKPEYIFTEFEGNYTVDVEADGEGDVKYHKGASLDFTTRKGKAVHLSLAFNPSHLEFVNPVVEGMARAKQNRLGDTTGAQVLPILIHGDAAFAGQGVCYETLQMTKLEGYRTGGTLHIVINNQVGFTTSPVDARSTNYSTDLAKMLDAPIFHVSGDDPEAAWTVAKICVEYRQKFKTDAFIDLICYRKHGHNEGDEPSFTQPLLYKKIKAHASTRELYAQSLAQAGVLSATDAQALVDEITAKFTEAQKKAKAGEAQPYISSLDGAWKGLKKAAEQDLHVPAKTAVAEKTIKMLAEKLNTIPAGFHLHSKLTRFFEARLKAVQEGRGIDWGNGEALAFASLLHEGHAVRITGQDAERGTFTHRHSVLNDFETGQKYSPFNNLGPKQAPYMVHNSFLSETGVMGFEYGYSLAAPNALVIWEAQFGDFANGAQVIIDQFITTSESKWKRMNGLVLLLPHGYEGQGPEHSSARLERFLQLAGRGNIIVCNMTTPANLFHVLRRQLKRDFRKPLVIMSPKSLLRHPQAVSNLDEFTQGEFREVIGDNECKADQVKRVLLCSGKVYYDLASERLARKREDVAIVRLEQLYPWPEAKLAAVLNGFSKAKELVWVQDEPRNMGAWTHVFNHWAGGLGEFNKLVGGRMIRYAGRAVGSSPAVGSTKVHEAEQKALLDQAFSELK